MSFKSTVLAALLAAPLATAAFADGMMIKDSYARSAFKTAKTGAAFIVIDNHTGKDDRLVSATSDAAKRVELHTHIESEGGVMKMTHVEEGFPVKAGESITMQRGGKHVMFMGLNKPFLDGEQVEMTLVFEKAGEVRLSVPVDLERKPMDGEMKHKMEHGAHTSESGEVSN